MEMECCDGVKKTRFCCLYIALLELGLGLGLGYLYKMKSFSQVRARRPRSAIVVTLVSWSTL